MRINKSRATYYVRCLRRAKEAFIETRGIAGVAQREADIAALPSKDWNGSQVFQVMCEGPFGKGPHVQFVPEYVLWSLIDLRHFMCAYHR